MHPLFAFVDEYGDPSLETQKSGVTDHFVIVAVMVQPEERQRLDDAIDSIRRKHFQTGEIKSNKVGTNWARRDRILQDLCGLDFRCHVLLIDKSEIRKSSGLQYKRSFLKYIHGLMYRRLYGAIPDLRVIADQHGSHPFMEGFRDYVRRQHIPDLFEQADLYFEDSKLQPMIQLADFLAGTIGNAAAAKGRTLGEVLEQLRERIITFASWPPASRIYVPPVDETKRFDHVVAVHSLNQASRFLRDHGASDDFHIQCQITVLQHLYFHCQFISEKGYVSTRELQGIIAEGHSETLSTHVFRAKVIAPLRDAGVLLASCSKGYKLPVTVTDIGRFVSHGHSIIGPLLARLQTARDELLTASDGELDVLEAPELQYLKKLRAFQHSIPCSPSLAKSP